MKKIKELLKRICKDVIEQNNKPFKLFEGGISNHIFDEKGVQMKIGLSLIKELDLEKGKKLNLQFEKKFFNENLDKKDYLDIYFYYEDKRIGIEVKFKTKGIRITKKVRGRNIIDEIATQERRKKFKYRFSNQGAETNGHHSFFWDLHRLNKFISDKKIDLGYQIFITNDPSYWKEKTKGSSNGYIIVDQDGELKISEQKVENNSHKFQMCHETSLHKKMDAPNWTSVDSIKGQNEGRIKLKENLKKKIEEKKFLYCQKEIHLEHIVDDKIEWLPQKIEHRDEVKDNPARGKIKKEKSKKFDLITDNEKQATTKFAFIIVELKKEK